MRPDAILLDEPTAMLDPCACRELGDCLVGLPALKIIATHDLTFAEKVCPQCLVLEPGRLRYCGRTADLLSQTDLLRACGLA